MAFHVDHWLGPRFAVLALDGMIGEQQLLRAVDTTLRAPVLLLRGKYAFDEWDVNHNVANMLRVLEPNKDYRLEVRAVFELIPGVCLSEIIGQSRDCEGQMPVEAAAHVAITAARVLHDMRAHYVQPLMGSRIRVGFDGSVVLMCPLRPTYHDHDDYLEAIRIIAPSYTRRVAPPEPGIAPEEVDPLYARDMRSEVFRLGALLQQLLDNEHPFDADHPLHAIEALQHDRRRPLKRDVAAALRELIARALAANPTDRFIDPGAFADALAAAVPTVHVDGPAATKALACGMFPRLREEQLHELEQIAMLDYAELISDAPTQTTDGDVITRNARPPPAMRTRMVFRSGAFSYAADNQLVSNKDFVEFLDATHRPDPPSFVGRIPELADEPAVLIGPADAAAYAAWRNGFLPSEPEWEAMVSLLTVPDVTRVWEWTSTPMRTGFIVRGGPWRNRTGAGRVDNRSWEDAPCADVGFRVFYGGQANGR
jgi:hypothetical protein